MSPGVQRPLLMSEEFEGNRGRGRARTLAQKLRCGPGSERQAK